MYLNDRKLLPDVPDKNNLPPVIVGYAGPKTPHQNIIVNINQRPIFREIYYSKWPCLKDLETSRLDTFLLTVHDYIQRYETSLLRGDVSYVEKTKTQQKAHLASVIEDAIDNVKSGKWDKNKIPACFLPDPDPALVGPPSQTIYGTINKAPSVDNPNLKLPSSTPKQLDPSKALTEVDKKEDDIDKMLDKNSADLDKMMSDSANETPTSSISDPNAVTTRTVTSTNTVTSKETVTGGGVTVRTSFASDDPRSRMTSAELDALPNGAGQK